MNLYKQKNKQDLDEVMAVLRDHKGRALHVMEVCARLGVEGDSRDHVRAALEILEEEGRVQQLPGLRFRALKAREVRGRVEAPAEERAQRRAAPNAKLGTLRIHARGHGFV